MSRQVKKVNISGKEDKSNKVTSWSNTTTDTHYPSEKLVKDSLDGKASSTHNHTKSQITDFPTSMTPTSHTHGNLQNNGQVGSTAQASKNVVTDSSGKITTEDKPTIPTASSTTPSADTENGSVGTGTTWARSNHTHPKSSIYAEASHTHSQYLTSHQDITGKEDKSNKLTSLNGHLIESDTYYPSSLLVLNHLDTKEDITNKVTSISSASTDDEYPSALCVYDAIDNETSRISNIEDTIDDLGVMAFNDTIDAVAGGSDIIDILERDGYSLFSGDYDDLDNIPTIPATTSDLTNDGDGTSPFLTGHDLTNYLQKNDVNDNLTSTDTNKPLSAKQGKELKSLVDGKQDIIKSITVTNEGRLYLLTQSPRYITYSNTKSMLAYEDDYADISIIVTDENREIIEGAEVQFYIRFEDDSSSPTRYLYTDNTGYCTTRVFSEELSTSYNQINIKYGEYTSTYSVGRQPNIELIEPL